MGTCCHTREPAQHLSTERQNSKMNKTQALTSRQGENVRVIDKAFLQFTQRIKKQIEDNQNIYKQYIPLAELLKILSEYNNKFYDNQSSKQLVGLIIDFLRYCKNQSGCEPQLLTTFTSEFTQQFAIRWQKIREPVYFANKSHLRVLSFIVKSPKSNRSQYGAYFQQFKMDLIQMDAFQRSCKELAAIVIKMCQQNINSFAFLTNYLWGSYLNLNKKHSIQKIQESYNKILKKLCDKYRPAPQIKDQNKHMEVHSLTKQQKLIPKVLINLAGKFNKDQFLNDCIIEQADKAKQKYDEFFKFMQQICQKNDGFHFKSGLKIKEKSEKKALLRIKEKILKDIYSEKYLEKKMGDLDIKSNSKQSLEQMVEDERRRYQQKMKEIYDDLKEPIQFKVNDMLRGSCAFSIIEKVNQCCADIKTAIRTQKYSHSKLIEIDNRLSKGTSDLVLTILFGDVITEMKLVIDLNSQDYAFANKLYELQRPKFYTPLTQLYIMNETLSSGYFIEAKAYIDGNSHSNAENYEQATTFEEVSNIFGDFVRNLPSKVEINRQFEGNVDFTLINEEMVNFNQLVNARFKQKKAQINLWEPKYAEGDYYFRMKDYRKSRQLLKEAFQQISSQSKKQSLSKESKQQLEKEKIKILTRLGDTQRESGKYIEAQDYYKNCLHIQERVMGKGTIETASTLVNMGLVYANQGDYPKALQVYKQALQIKQRVKGKGSIDTVIQFGHMGTIYANQGDYFSALEAFKQALQIKEVAKGKGSIDTVMELGNMGLVYTEQGDYPKALQAYKRVLNIQEKVNGKGNIDTASTLGNIGTVYLDLDDCPEALQMYKRALQIKERSKGKGSIDTVSTLLNMGTAYATQGDFSSALQVYKQALQIQERVKGKGSFDTASIIGNMGLVYADQGDYSKALQVYKQALQIKQRVKGKGSIDTASTIGNMGTVYADQGDYQTALQVYKQALQIQERGKGKGSIETASTLNNIGDLYKEQGDYALASKSLQQSLSIFKKYGRTEAKIVANSLLYCYKALNEDEKCQTLIKEYNINAD